MKRITLARLTGLVLGAMSAALAGCGQQKQPLTVELTQLGPYLRAARPPDCQMPLLGTMPLRTYSQVAIVEAWADVKDQQTDVVPALQRKACETGADALVIVNSEHQDIKNLLYAATPNQTMNEVTLKNGYAGGGDYIKVAEHTRRIGEAGHNGFYIDAVAISYGSPEDKRSRQSALPAPAAPPAPPNG